MALRDQPYIPLYVQDFLTDEKLNSCSASAQGVYIKIMCILHKQETYGSILFKQKDKQNSSMIKNFALKFAKLLPFDTETLENALTELIEEGVLIVEGDILYQKRMVKDFQLSIARSKAAKKGGGNPILFKQNNKQKDKQNTEYENEYEIENEIELNTEEWKEKSKKELNALYLRFANPEYIEQLYHALQRLGANRDQITALVDQFFKEKRLNNELNKPDHEIRKHLTNYLKQEIPRLLINQKRLSDGKLNATQTAGANLDALRKHHKGN